MGEDEKLIEYVRKYPVLYDFSNSKYMDAIFKNGIWRKIGNELNVDGAACKSRWNNIRDTYRKSLKKNATKSGQGAKKMKMYKYSELLNFLKKCAYEEIEIKSNIESVKVEPDDETQDTMEENNDSLLSDGDITGSVDLPEHTQDQSKECPKLCPSNCNKKRTNTEEEYEPTAARKLMKYIISNEKGQPPQSQHPVDTFLASIAATLKTFSPYHLLLAKAEIFNTAQKYEYETIMEHEIDDESMTLSQFPSSSSSIIPTQYSPTIFVQKEEDNTV